EADVFEIEHIYDYPTTDDHVCVIVPRSIPVVIRWYHEWDYGEDQGYREILYIFTKEGWKKIDIR
ncbi:MAG: hypothetical protein DRP01_03265, partial [Archaeoglobales archaeon]